VVPRLVVVSSHLVPRIPSAAAHYPNEPDSRARKH
jgi:hypothetical protein